MTLSNAGENGLLDLLFLNTDFANVGDAGGLQNSASAGSLYVSLHTADPGEAGDQTTSESAYTNYARVAVARSGSGWSRSGNVISNVAEIAFPACGVTGSTITHCGIGTATSGAGVLIASGTATLSVSSGITPKFAIGALTFTLE